MLLVPAIQIVVHREGKNVRPPLGKAFDFTDAEIAEIRAHRHDALRRPVNESAGDAAVAVPENRVAAGQKTAPPAARKAGKAVPAATEDEEDL